MFTDYSRPLSDVKKERIGCKRSHLTEFSEYQLSELRKRYKVDKYIQGKEKEAMAKSLGVSMSRVSDWFKCTRKKDNKRKKY